jgi:hypothetical protein
MRSSSVGYSVYFVCITTRKVVNFVCSVRG